MPVVAATTPTAASLAARTIDVLGVGDTSMDVFVAVDRIAVPGEKVRGRHLGLHPGGVVANLCAATARFGLRTRLVSVVGDDVFGGATVDDLRSRGVAVDGVRTLPSTATYLCLVSVTPDGDKALTIAETAAMFPSPDQISEQELRAARHVHLTPLDLDDALAIARRARAAGATVSVDLEPTSMVGAEGSLGRLLGSTDVLLPNSHAIRAGWGESPTLELAQRLTAMGPRWVAIGCGAAGAIIADRDDAIEVPAFDVEVRDATGAGDAFNAGILLGWLEGWSLAQSGAFASASAAHVVTAVGARTAQPTRSEVESLLAAGHRSGIEPESTP